MSITCKVHFEDKLFYTGQVIRGKVALKLEEYTIIRSVCIQFYGVAHIDKAANQLSSRTVVYLNHKSYLFGSDDGKPKRLVHGTHNYSFDCKIPPELPTSIEGEFGHIRYTVRIVVNVTDRPYEMKFEEPFTVIRPRDLNLNQSLANPVFGRYKETFLSSKPLNIVARLPVGGYVPGQTINLKLSVDNQSDETVLRFNVELIKEIMYHITADSDQKRIETIVLNETETVGCDKKRDQIIFVNILVPPVPPNDLGNIINAKYSIRIKGEMDNCIYGSPVLDIPVEIGTYPLKDGTAQTMTNDVNDAMAPNPSDEEDTILSNYVARELPSAPPMSSSFDKDESAVEDQGGPSSFPQDDLPTYDEAMMSNPDLNQFRPIYPTYRRRTSSSIGD